MNIVENFAGIQSKVLNLVDKLYISVGFSFLFINIPNGRGGRKRFTWGFSKLGHHIPKNCSVWRPPYLYVYLNRIYVSVCMHECMHVCTILWLNVWVYAYVCTIKSTLFVCTYGYIYVQWQMRIYVWTIECVWLRMIVCIEWTICIMRAFTFENDSIKRV